MLDKDGDGTINTADLTSMLTSLGPSPDSPCPLSHSLPTLHCIIPHIYRYETKYIYIGLDNSSSTIKQMLSLVPSPLDFPAFLTHLTVLSQSVSPRDDIIGAFTAFDESDSGYVDYEELKSALLGSGTMRMTAEEVDAVVGASVERGGRRRGMVAYARFCDAVLGERRGG